MIITHEINVDLSRKGCDPMIHATQGDTNAHQLNIRITNNRKNWTVPAELSALVHYSNAYGSGGSYCTLPDGSPAGRITSTGICITLVPEMMALPGSVRIIVTLQYGQHLLSTVTVCLMVAPLAKASSPVLANYSNLAGYLPTANSASVNQFLQVQAVDSHGHVTEIRAVDLPDGSASSGQNGITPHIGANGNWYLGNADTGVKASGEDGHTPVKGTDYYTQADEEAFKAFLSAELAKRNQLQPAYAANTEECTDPDKLYVLPDGYIYAHMSTNTLVKDNYFDTANVTLNKRISSSGSESAANGIFTTDYIPVSIASADPYKIRVPLKYMPLGFGQAVNGCLIALYNSSKGFLSRIPISNSAALNTYVPYDVDGDDLLLYAGYSYSHSAGAPVKCSNYDSIAYIRIGFAANADGTAITAAPQDCSVYLEPLIRTENINGWQSTGHAFVPADYEPRILSLEQSIAKLQNLHSAGISVPAFWEDALSACISKIRALQSGKHCITFPFFSDSHNHCGYAGVLIAKVMQECHIPYCFYGGDAISSGFIENETAMLSQERMFKNMMSAIPNGRLCRAVGNHDGYWAVSESESHTYSRDQIYEAFLREESAAQNQHYGQDGTYFYVDDLSSRVRFIVLNSNNSGFDTAQILWLQNTALQFSESGWAVVFISHHPVTNNFHSNLRNAKQMQECLCSYISSTGNNKAEIIGWFSGHIHRDRIYQCDHTDSPDADDTTTATLPWKTITITSDNTAISYDTATKHTPASDNLSHAIDFVTINRNTGTVHLTRLGIGDDRSFIYRES